MKRTWILPLLLFLAFVVTLGAPAANAEDGAVKGRVAAVKKALSLTKISLETPSPRPRRRRRERPLPRSSSSRTVSR